MLDQILPLQLSVLPSQILLITLSGSQIKIDAQVKVQLISWKATMTGPMASKYALVTLVQNLLKVDFFDSALQRQKEGKGKETKGGKTDLYTFISQS